LSLSDTAPTSVIKSRPYRYTLAATNTGGSVATGVTITDTLPGSVRFGSATVTEGSCTRAASGPSKASGGTVSCTVGSLAAGNSMTVTIQVTATKPGTVSDSAHVTAGNVTSDSDDSGSAPVTVQRT